MYWYSVDIKLFLKKIKQTEMSFFKSA